MPKTKDNRIKWSELNERQQKTLEAVFDQDEELNRDHSAGRWMPYNSAYSSLKSTLSFRKLVDAGTTSTFKALEICGLLETRYNPKTEFRLLELRITRPGRQLVVDALGKTSSADSLDIKRLPKGTLRRWHWDALARAVAAGEEGLHGANAYYGNIGWNTWLRLRNYYDVGEGLVEEFLVTETLNDRIFQYHKLRATDAGRKYYRENWQKYREMYPDVPAPEPKTEKE